MGFLDKAKELAKQGKESLEEYNAGLELRKLRSNRIFCSNVKLEYMGGGLLKKDGILRVTVRSKYLKYGKFILPISQITSVDFKTQQEIESRYTATRIIALGVLALAFKKKKKHNLKYLSIEYNDGFEGVIIFGGKATTEVYTALREAIKQRNTFLQYLKDNNMKDDESPIQIMEEDQGNDEIEELSEDSDYDLENGSNFDPYEEVKKAKELLDMGILTQEEFEKKKKNLLGL